MENSISHFLKIDTVGDEMPEDAEIWEAVQDNRTGLIWAKDDIKVDNWNEAAAAVEKLTTAGFADWRLPTVEELFLLVDRERSYPAIDTSFFPDCKSDWYWSSTPYARSPGDCAWVVGFYDGGASWSGRDDDGFVRAVRAGQS